MIKRYTNKIESLIALQWDGYNMEDVLEFVPNELILFDTDIQILYISDIAYEHGDYIVKFDLNPEYIRYSKKAFSDQFFMEVY